MLVLEPLRFRRRCEKMLSRVVFHFGVVRLLLSFRRVSDERLLFFVFGIARRSQSSKEDDAVVELVENEYVPRQPLDLVVVWLSFSI